MKKYLVTGLLFAWVFMLAACGGGDDSEGGGNSQISDLSETEIFQYIPLDCSTEKQNKFVYEIMTNSYLWYDKVPEVDYRDYASPEALLDAIKYDTLDKWSYITSKEKFYAYFKYGEYISMGFGLKYDTNGDVRVSFVYKNSPADLAGIKRGEKLIEINEKTVKEIEDSHLWNNVSGPDEVGITSLLALEDSEGLVRETEIRKERISINTVLYDEILMISGLKIGYLVFKSFIESSPTELDTVFDSFKQEEIDELILDLRYNTGGKLSVARHLASLIAGDNAAGEIFQKYIHNDKYRDRDYVMYFTKPPKALDLDRVVIITSESTCSASESVINNLKPFADVVLIGRDTCGKPVGMYGYDFCDKLILPIEFKTANAHNEGDYFDGIPPTCYSEDDLTMPFGDTQEDSLQEALNYILTESCSDDSARQSFRNQGDRKKIKLNGFRGETGAF
ncbi:S41 family peptidase [Desulfonema magnum]|uniref:PDZ domain-containing protein n=1 Tax=Desulfonema magnum TaxID=45655 RepID=A0A975BLI9_9BACT|nr:S41 family peptidase [Desulfonema magnum]QTA87325.1 PDZ domain-containing protein [Desulfonema magnum]